MTVSGQPIAGVRDFNPPGKRESEPISLIFLDTSPRFTIITALGRVWMRNGYPLSSSDCYSHPAGRLSTIHLNGLKVPVGFSVNVITFRVFQKPKKGFIHT